MVITKNRIPNELVPVKASGFMKDFFSRMMMGRRGTYHREVKLITGISDANRMQIKNGILMICNNSQPLAAVNVRKLVKKATNQHYSEIKREGAQVDFKYGSEYMGTAFMLDRGILAVYTTGKDKISIRYAGSTHGQTTYYGGGANEWKGMRVVGTTPTEVLLVDIYGQQVVNVDKQALPLSYAAIRLINDKDPISLQNIQILDERHVERGHIQRIFSYSTEYDQFRQIVKR